eukprot:696957-Rhodomonas_salina.1
MPSEMGNVKWVKVLKLVYPVEQGNSRSSWFLLTLITATMWPTGILFYPAITGTGVEILILLSIKRFSAIRTWAMQIQVHLSSQCYSAINRLIKCRRHVFWYHVPGNLAIAVAAKSPRDKLAKRMQNVHT